MNQMTETHRVIDLAILVSHMTGQPYQLVHNPRNEAVENDLVVCNDSFLKLGLNPTKLQEGLADEVATIARRFADRCDRSKIPCVSHWVPDDAKEHAEAVAGAQILVPAFNFTRSHPEDEFALKLVN